MSSNKKYEVDPAIVTKVEDMRVHKQNLINLVNVFLENVQESISMLPLTFFTLFGELQKQVETKFPTQGRQAVGGFFFLRFICPSLISPETNGLFREKTHLSSDTRRVLVLVSKIIQNISNNREFTEDYMLDLNAFIASSQAVVKRIFDSVMTPAQNEEILNSMPEADPATFALHQLIQNTRQSVVTCLHYYFYACLHDIEKKNLKLPLHTQILPKLRIR